MNARWDRVHTTSGVATLKPREATVRTRGTDNRLVFAERVGVW